jgi:hypothetical protein
MEPTLVTPKEEEKVRAHTKLWCIAHFVAGALMAVIVQWITAVPNTSPSALELRRTQDDVVRCIARESRLITREGDTARDLFWCQRALGSRGVDGGAP